MQKFFINFLYIACIVSLLCFSVFRGYGQDRLFETQLIKVNVLPLGARSFGVSYETSWNEQWSASLSFSARPSNDFPFKNELERYYSDQDIEFVNTQISHFSITPEVRKYLSTSGGLRGFYLGMFLQYARFGYKGNINYVGGGNNNPSQFAFDGGINTVTAGASIGRQWRFGQSLYLDWQILAPSFGFNVGKIQGNRIGGRALDPVSIRVIENKPNEFHTPLVDVNVDAESDRIKVNTNGAWAGLRVWLAFGYRF